MKHGKGKMVYPSGNYYEGDWAFDKKEGYGTLKWPDGTIYEGYWKDGKQHNEGNFEYWQDGVKKVKRVKWN